MAGPRLKPHWTEVRLQRGPYTAGDDLLKILQKILLDRTNLGGPDSLWRTAHDSGFALLGPTSRTRQ